MESIGFKQSTTDSCVYIQIANTITIVAVYVDDLIVITKNPEEMMRIKETLATQFKMKDMGPLHYCLGISIEQDKDQKCIWVHQKQYILKMLEKYGFPDSKVVSTPADVNNELRKG